MNSQLTYALKSMLIITIGILSGCSSPHEAEKKAAKQDTKPKKQFNAEANNPFGNIFEDATPMEEWSDQFKIKRRTMDEALGDTRFKYQRDLNIALEYAENSQSTILRDNDKNALAAMYQVSLYDTNRIKKLVLTQFSILNEDSEVQDEILLDVDAFSPSISNDTSYIGFMYGQEMGGDFELYNETVSIYSLADKVEIFNAEVTRNFSGSISYWQDQFRYIERKGNTVIYHAIFPSRRIEYTKTFSQVEYNDLKNITSEGLVFRKHTEKYEEDFEKVTF